MTDRETAASIQPGSTTWLRILRHDGDRWFQQPPKEIILEDALPDDTRITIGARSQTLGELRRTLTLAESDALIPARQR